MAQAIQTTEVQIDTTYRKRQKTYQSLLCRPKGSDDTNDIIHLYKMLSFKDFVLLLTGLLTPDVDISKISAFYELKDFMEDKMWNGDNSLQKQLYKKNPDFKDYELLVPVIFEGLMLEIIYDFICYARDDDKRHLVDIDEEEGVLLFTPLITEV